MFVLEAFLSNIIYRLLSSMSSTRLDDRIHEITIFRQIKNFLNSNVRFWVFLVILYFFTRLTTWFYPIDGDHWIFWVVGKDLAEGGTLYITSWDHKAPLIFLFNAFLYIVGKDNVWIHRIIITLVSLFGVYIFYKLSIILTNFENKKVFNIKVKIALIFYVLWINLSHISSGGNNNENLGLIFLTSSYFFYLKFFESKKLGLLMIAGFLVSCLFFLKANFLILALPILIHILFIERKNIKNLVKYFMILGIPFLAHTGLWILYFYSNNSLEEFFKAAFLFNSKYISSGWIGKVSGQLVFIAINIPLITTFLLALYLAAKKFNAKKNNHLYIFLISIGISSLIFVSMLGTFYPYYYLMIIPSISLIYGTFLTDLNFNRPINKTLSITVIFSMVIASVISLKQPYNFFSGEAKSDFEEKIKVARYIKNISTNDDKIIAYVYGSTFYYLTNRKMGTRYASASHMLLDYRDNYGFNLNDKFIKDAENNRPKFVIMLKDQNNLYSVNKPLIDYFNRHYVFDKSFDKYIVLKRID